jgi:hypothetical protein
LHLSNRYKYGPLIYSCKLCPQASKYGIKGSRRNAALENIVAGFNNPEEINDEPNSPPSNRIQALKNDYRKVAMGKTVSKAIGIQTIRKQCPHFNSWLNKLENLTV